MTSELRGIKTCIIRRTQFNKRADVTRSRKRVIPEILVEISLDRLFFRAN